MLIFKIDEKNVYQLFNECPSVNGQIKDSGAN